MKRVLSVLLFLPTLAVGQDHPLYINVVDSKTLLQVEAVSPRNLRSRLSGHEVKVLGLEKSSAKHKVSIVLDLSVSMKDSGWPQYPPRPPQAAAKAPLPLAVRVAARVLKELDGKADVSLVAFSEKVTETIPSGAGANAVEQKLLNLYQHYDSVPHGRTPMRDAVMNALKFEKLGPGDALFLISDGGENVSQTDEKLLRQQIISSGVRVFGFVIPPKLPSSAVVVEGLVIPELERLASESGGYLIQWPKPGVGPDMIDRLAKIMSNPIEVKLATERERGGKFEITYVEASGKRQKGTIVLAPRQLKDSPQQLGGK